MKTLVTCRGFIWMAAAAAAIQISAALALADEDPSNAYCPVITDEPVDPDIFTEYEGRTVYFCCAKCRRKFLEDPDAYLPALASPESEKDEHEHDAEDGVHDHAHDHGEGQAEWAAYLGKLHPMTVHFPIALFVMTGLGELLLVITRREAFGDFARISLWIGTITGLAAGLFGWLNHEGRSWEGAEAELVSNHKYAAIALLTVAIAALLVRPRDENMKNRRGVIYRVLVAALVILTAVTGHLGGSLVFGPDYLDW